MWQWSDCRKRPLCAPEDNGKLKSSTAKRCASYKVCVEVASRYWRSDEITADMVYHIVNERRMRVFNTECHKEVRAKEVFVYRTTKGNGWVQWKWDPCWIRNGISSFLSCSRQREVRWENYRGQQKQLLFVQEDERHGNQVSTYLRGGWNKNNM